MQVNAYTVVILYFHVFSLGSSFTNNRCGVHPNSCIQCLGKTGMKCDHKLFGDSAEHMRKPVSELTVKHRSACKPVTKVIGKTFNAAKYGQCEIDEEESTENRRRRSADGKGCHDEFISSTGLTCDDYINKSLCTPTGGYGAAWAENTFATYANRTTGYDASSCSVCGCQSIGNIPRCTSKDVSPCLLCCR